MKQKRDESESKDSNVDEWGVLVVSENLHNDEEPQIKMRRDNTVPSY